MSIKAKIIIIIIMAGAFAVGTGAILHSSKKEMTICYEKERITASISKGVFELNLLTNDFLRHPLNRTLTQWKQKNSSLLSLLNSNKSLFHDDLSDFNTIAKKLKMLEIYFSKLSNEITTGRWGVSAHGYNPGFLLYEAKLSALSHDMINSAQALRIDTHSQLKFSQDNAARSVFILFIFLSAMIIAFSWIFISSVLKPVGLLTKGAMTIGNGNFDYKIEVPNQDEIGFLSNAFNEMSARLKKITVHRSELEKEIAERKQMELKILESEALFRAVFEQAGGYCMLLQPTDDGIPTILDANAAACRTHGYTKEEMIGRPVADLDDEEGKRLCRERTKFILTGKTLAIENNHIRKDGSVFPVAVFANVVQYQNKPPIILTTEFDISDRKKAEAEKQLLEKQLQQAYKMESIGNLAGGIAHDFNNILSAVIGYTELALDDVTKGTQLEDNLQEVYKAGKRARDLVKQILAFSRQSDEERKPIQVDVIAKEVLKLIRSTIPTTVEIKQTIETDSMIMGNASQVHQLLLNLCTNAAHAMENSGGILGIRLTDVNLDDQSSIRLGLSAGDYMLISVSDTGSGISPDIIDSVFEPYFTTKGVGEGTGMGLAMVHGIVEAYGGEITVDSELEKGSVFSIYLPITKKRKAHRLYESTEIPTGTERILLVDDEAPIAKMESQVLERLGYTVTTRTSSVDALALFKTQPNDFDLVITDMTMPTMTGDKLAIEIIKRRADIPVILFTGYNKKISNETASEVGIKAFAYKPIVKADLAKTVRKVLDDARA